MEIVKYILLGFSLAATLGPITVETVNRGLKHGFFPAFLLNIGAVVADGVYLVLIFFGLSTFADNSMFKLVLTIFGVLVLGYLGVGNIREFTKDVKLTKNTNKTFKGSLLAGFIINMANPMALICWVGFYGVVSATTKNLTNIKLLGNLGVVIVGALLWGIFLALLCHVGRKYVNEKIIKVISLITGLFLIGFGIYLAYGLKELI
ncbi:LysE family translocator [Candidatus Gracilibacteria bacterium]|nr:LysE family translocator [Candidatus Gracilibacteria bacterium]